MLLIYYKIKKKSNKMFNLTKEKETKTNIIEIYLFQIVFIYFIFTITYVA